MKLITVRVLSDKIIVDSGDAVKDFSLNQPGIRASTKHLARKLAEELEGGKNEQRTTGDGRRDKPTA